VPAEGSGADGDFNVRNVKEWNAGKQGEACLVVQASFTKLNDGGLVKKVKCYQELKNLDCGDQVMLLSMGNYGANEQAGAFAIATVLDVDDTTITFQKTINFNSGKSSWFWLRFLSRKVLVRQRV
jgi:hypothetical protein